MMIRRLASAFLAAAAAAFAPVSAHAAAELTEVSGAVMVRYQTWEAVDKTPFPLDAGATVRTAAQAHAVLTFSDGSRVELGGNSSFTLEESQADSLGLSLTAGRLKAFVTRLASRRFSVRTPTAVCAVRGTEFLVEVHADGSTSVDLYKGLLAIDDLHGRQLLLHPGESARVDPLGLPSSNRRTSRRDQERARLRGAMRRELAMDVTRRQIQAEAVRELKLADYQQGKTAMNVFGQLVRVEEYIVRPAPDAFKLVVLNSIRTEGFSYFYYRGTFNAVLPADLSVALSQLSGRPDAPPSYYLTSFETGRSNTIDSVVEIANGGHPVDVNGNASNDPSEAVASYFDPARGAFVPLAPGSPFYKTLFDNEGFYVDGKLKSGWTGSGLLTYSSGYGAYGPTAASLNDPITGTALAAPLPTVTQNSTFPNPGQIHQTIYSSYSDGTFVRWDSFITDDQGRIATAAQFSGPTSGSSFTQQLLKFNYEQVITASEFGGRAIDLVVAPKILVQSGLIP